MCSTTFQAAGLDGLQFVFYPSGSFGAKEGYCSCFLFYPGRTALHCWLSVGNQRREAKLSVTSAGFFGRTNFCRLEHGVDSTNDTLNLVLEIDEAQQEVTKFSAHQANHSVRTSSPPPGANTSGVSGLGDTTVESVLRLQKTSGHLQDVKQLPSIWTASQFHIEDSLEGFRNFKDLPSKRRQNNRNGAHPDMYKTRPGTVSSMSMYSHDTSRPESRQRPGSRSAIERASSPDRQGANSTLSMYSDIQACPPASARPVQRNAVRDVLSARYAAYMG